jgi:hypothetical protein
MHMHRDSGDTHARKRSIFLVDTHAQPYGQINICTDKFVKGFTCTGALFTLMLRVK